MPGDREPRTEAGRVLLAFEIDGSEETEAAYRERFGRHAEWQDVILAIEAEAASDSTTRGDLDAAWAEAEAALATKPIVGRHEGGWLIRQISRTAPAYPAEWFVEVALSRGKNLNYDSAIIGRGPTPAAALRALAVALSSDHTEAKEPTDAH